MALDCRHLHVPVVLQYGNLRMGYHRSLLDMNKLVCGWQLHIQPSYHMFQCKGPHIYTASKLYLEGIQNWICIPVGILHMDFLDIQQYIGIHFRSIRHSLHMDLYCRNLYVSVLRQSLLVDILQMDHPQNHLCRYRLERDSIHDNLKWKWIFDNVEINTEQRAALSRWFFVFPHSLASKPQDPGHGSWHRCWIHACWLGHSEFKTHSGLQFGGLPWKFSKHVQAGKPLIIRHTEFGPQGDGTQLGGGCVWSSCMIATMVNNVIYSKTAID